MTTSDVRVSRTLRPSAIRITARDFEALRKDIRKVFAEDTYKDTDEVRPWPGPCTCTE
jgi:hypothetical protein